MKRVSAEAFHPSTTGTNRSTPRQQAETLLEKEKRTLSIFTRRGL